MKNLLLVVCLLSLFYSCSDKEKEKELLSRIETLEQELDDCKNGEDKMIGLIRNAFEGKNYKLASKTYTELSNKYPSSSHIAEGREIFNKANEEIKKEQQAAIKKLEDENAAKRASLSKLKKKFDDISGIYWYNQKYFTHYTNSNRASIEMGKRKDQAPWLNLMLSYTGEDWIFFTEAYLSYDGNTRQIFFDKYDDKKSDNGSGGVWEWIHVKIEKEDLEWFKSFANSKTAKMRLSGKYQKTRELTSQERQGILDIIAGYEYLTEFQSIN